MSENQTEFFEGWSGYLEDMYHNPDRFVITDPAQCWTCGMYLKDDKTCPVCDAPEEAGSTMSDERFHKRMVRIIHEASLRAVMERINRDCLRWM